ncbi:MAG: ABC-F family ATP-binding cassette domain-containing protein [Candidatus Schekmanbacteria bacterium]|nr:ABC-F family ATP-binding cassette domain-containing protein [Candidatus Schekmanbacteria bacterium]
MSLAVVQDLGLSFGGRALMSGVCFLIGEGDRLGLIGPNGSGKTTLLRMLNGTDRPDTGTISFAKHVRLGYLPQDIAEVSDAPLLASVLSAVPGRLDIEERLEEAQCALETSHDSAEQMRLAQSLADLSEHLAHFEAHYSQHQAERILHGLGFRNSDFERPLSTFSGGWRMRAVLGGLLFADPDLLLLDEPTNHLDLPSVMWLAGFLRESHQALILISHDKSFLNRQVDRVLSFEPEGFRTYRGNYDSYLQQRDQEKVTLMAASRNVEREKRQAEAFIRRFRAKATKARQVQSRIRKLEKLDDVVTLQEFDTVSFRFPPAARSGDEVVRAEHLTKRYGSNTVFTDLDLYVRRGDRIVVTGVNGAGKTTLLRILAGELRAEEGSVRYGAGVEVAYYAQHQTEALNLTHTILEEVWAAAPRLSQSFIRSALGAFLFSGDAVDKPIQVLSGGEKARVALARLLVHPANLLLMDEPTNHLDIASCEALQEALAAFDGTIVFVSHNFGFATALATSTWAMGDGGLEAYPGRLDEYLRARAPELLGLAPATTTAAATPAATPATSAKPAPSIPAASTGARAPKRPEPPRSKDQRRVDAEALRVRNTRLKPLRERAIELEGRIAGLEKQQTDLERTLADPGIYADRNRYAESLSRYQDNIKKLEDLMRRWERAQQDLDRAERE